MTLPSDSPAARGPLAAGTLKPLRLHPVPAGPAPRRGGFESERVAAFLAGLTAQYDAGTGVFPSPLAATRPPRLSP